MTFVALTAVFFAPTAVVLATTTPASATTTATFVFTGSQQSWTVPTGVTSVQVSALGARGGSSSTGGWGGPGGRVVASIPVTPGQVLYVYVGGVGNTTEHGYNGGGSGYFYDGGGASDVRIGGAALANRVLVAGGGGGYGMNVSTAAGGAGGAGGDSSAAGAGGAGTCGATAGAGATSSAGGAGGTGSVHNGTAGSLGQGGSGASYGGGGGGGYYGGGGGGTCSTTSGVNGGGGGGTNYVESTATAVSEWRGVSGEASVTLTWPPDTTTPPPADPGVATFVRTGSQQSWTVPAGVTSVQVSALGARGGSSSTGGWGGPGGRVVASLPVTPGQVLYLFVGGVGDTTEGAYNGGGSGWSYAGGGASDVRIGGVTLANRVLVAGGGGGYGLNATTSAGGAGGAGGDSSAAGAGGAGTCGATAGAGATSSAGGAGGAGSVSNGTAGSLGQGGSGASYGGGGGGGYYGGGGGGACTTSTSGVNGGGGGGTNYVESTASAVSEWRGVSGEASVTLTWPPDTTTPPPAAAGVATFVRTGSQQSWTVPAGVTSVQVAALGARGGSSLSHHGGLSGRIVVSLPVTPGQVLYLFVGGVGDTTEGAYNGGGSGWSYAGGGASDVRIGGVTLANRMVVGGGGGGYGLNDTTSNGGGGAGGDHTAAANGNPGTCGATAGAGATSSAGGAGGTGSVSNGTAGSFGQGGTSSWGGGGGGGYYGGGGGGVCTTSGSGVNGGGGGGTNYAASTATTLSDQQGVSNGSGLVVIAYPEFSAVGGSLSSFEEFATNLAEKSVAGYSADPVNTATGSIGGTWTDLALAGRGQPLSFQRSYSSFMAPTLGPLGYGGTDSYAMSLTLGTGSPPSPVTVNQENSTQVTFTWSGTAYTAPARVLATLVHNGDGTFTFTRRAKAKFAFSATGRLLSEADLNGNTTTLTYNGSGQLTTVTDPAGRTLTLAYNAASLVQSVTDSTSPARSVTYSYDASKNLTDVIDVRGGHTQFTYDSSHRLLTMRSPRFYGDTTTTPTPVTTNHYDANGRVDWQSDALGRTTTFAYTDYTTTITDPKGYVTVDQYRHGALVGETRGYGTAQAASWVYSYDPNTLGLTSVTDPLGHTSTATYDTAGNQLTATDPLANTSTATYDSLNDVTSATDPANVTTTYTYDGSGNPLTMSTPLVGSSPAVSRTVTYTHGDSTHPGDVTAVTDPNGKTSTFTYDTYGNQVSATDALGDKTSATFNARDDRLTVVSARGNVTGANPADFTTTYTYDPAGNALTETDPNGHATTTVYDADGNITSITDAKSHATTNTFDPAGELLTLTRPDSTTHTYTHDADGNQLTDTDGAGHTTTETYTNAAFPDLPATVTDALSRTTTYGYDTAGRTISQQQPSGNCSATPKTGCTSSTYDAAGRLTAINYSDGVTPNVTIGYNNLGQRTSMIDGTGTSNWTWDSLGRMTSSINGAGTTVSYGWDLAGNETSITYPGSHAVTRHFDNAERLDSLTDWQSHTTNFGYDPDSNLTTNTFPTATGDVDTFAYDHADRLTGITDTHSSTTIASLSYGRDTVNQLSSASSTGLGETAQSWTYTSLDQLASANSNNYTYDAGDNLTALASGATQGFDVANQLCWTKTSAATGTCASPPSGATTYSYDNRGNRTTITPSGGGATTLTYDQARRLTAYGGTATYTYNGAGLRESKTVGGTTTNFVWDESSGLPLLLVDATNSYIYGPGDRVVEHISSAGTPIYYHQDQLGSTRLLTDNTGAAVGTFNYDTYGNPSTSTGTVTTPFGWSGEYRDAETGLVYLRARYYDPTTGQFLTRDPLEASTKAAYSYGGDNPVNMTDPTGMFGRDMKELWNATGGVAATAIKHQCSGAWQRTANCIVLAASLFVPGGEEAAILEEEEQLASLGTEADVVEAGAAESESAALAGETEYGSTPGGRPFTRHYGVETGPDRYIPGSVVDEAIDNYPGKLIEGGKTVHYDPNNDITVVTGDGDSIVSARRGPPRANQR